MKRHDSTRHGGRARRRSRSPHFDSGVLPEPWIVFGGQRCHVDPKTGLSLYGPFSPAGTDEPVLSKIIVGTVGPPDMVADAHQWLDACRDPLTNDGHEPFLRPHFPGIRRESPFKCDLVHGDTWQETLRVKDIAWAVGDSDWNQRLRGVVRLYAGAIEVLAGREPKPHVVLCCIPDDVIEHCTVASHSGKPKAVPASRHGRKAAKEARAGQTFPFQDMTPTLGIEDEEGGPQNLRRGLKAEAMRFGVPTQLIWPRTLQLTAKRGSRGGRPVQDLATRAWNFGVALYHKAGGSPWRLEAPRKDTCYVGVSFYREVLEENPRLRTSMAQAFTAAGDGYVLRGEAFEWDESRRGRSPHLDRKSASGLMRGVLDLYQRQNRGRPPGRVVIHKTSLFTQEEQEGFEDACQLVPGRDFVAFGKRKIQFYRTGDYPPLRGTYVKFSDNEFALYTDGYIPFLRTYPGVRVPQPLDIMQHIGDSPWNTVLREVIGLTKMNWNTADFACSKPITIAFSRKVGEILAELPVDVDPEHNYRFYM